MLVGYDHGAILLPNIENADEVGEGVVVLSAGFGTAEGLLQAELGIADKAQERGNFGVGRVLNEEKWYSLPSLKRGTRGGGRARVRVAREAIEARMLRQKSKKSQIRNNVLK